MVKDILYNLWETVLEDFEKFIVGYTLVLENGTERMYKLCLIDIFLSDFCERKMVFPFKFVFIWFVEFDGFEKALCCFIPWVFPGQFYIVTEVPRNQRTK